MSSIQSLGMKYPKTERFWCVFEVEGKESSLPRQTVRMAGLGDVALLVSMNQELLRAESSRNPLDIEQLEERLRGWMKRAWQAAILEVDGAIAGYGLYRIGSDHFDDEGFYVELRQLFIAAGHRRQGLGRWFVERLRTPPGEPRNGADRGEDVLDPVVELGRDGLKIARRTVAKYRDQLGINSQRYRKDVF